MSISAKVVRSLIVTSPEYLAGILKNREEILNLNEVLKEYIWTWNKYQEGCRCDDDKNLGEVHNLYRQISTDTQIYNLLCQEFKCVDVKFYGI